MKSALEKDAMSEAPYGRVDSGRAKTRYEWCLEQELAARKTRLSVYRGSVFLNFFLIMALAILTLASCASSDRQWRESEMVLESLPDA